MHTVQAIDGRSVVSMYQPGQVVAVHVDMVAWTVKPIADKDGFVRVKVVNVASVDHDRVPTYHRDKDLVLHVQATRERSGYLHELEFWTLSDIRVEDIRPE